MKRLIVSADDFGLTESVNEGILKACREGIVTSINLLPSGEAFEDALKLIEDLKLEGVGAHLSLTETAPVTDSRKIPTLITKGNRFHKSHVTFLSRFAFGLVRESEIMVELENQLKMVEAAGLKITNLSSHEHIHMMPRMLNVFLRLADQHNIPSVRYPHGDRPIKPFRIDEIYKSFIFSYLNKGMRSLLSKEGIAVTDHFFGFLDSGRLGEDALIDIIESLKEGTTELVCHPGFLGPEILGRYKWHIRCEEELFALTSPAVKRLIKDKDIRLIDYQHLLSQ